jgi:heme exporter protein D
MPDNWGYVFAAYGVAALALAGYWRHLAHRRKALTGGRRRGGTRAQ